MKRFDIIDGYELVDECSDLSPKNSPQPEEQILPIDSLKVKSPEYTIREFNKGKSFEFFEWRPLTRYYNSEFQQDFVSYKGCLLACKKSHISDNPPEIIFDDSGKGIGINSEYWIFCFSGLVGPIGPKGDKGQDGKVAFESLTLEQIEMIRGPRGVKGDTGDKGDKGDTGAQGPQGKKGDKGEKGDPLIFDDLTEEQKSILKGEKGDVGEVGPAGPQGVSFTGAVPMYDEVGGSTDGTMTQHAITSEFAKQDEKLSELERAIEIYDGASFDGASSYPISTARTNVFMFYPTKGLSHITKVRVLSGGGTIVVYKIKKNGNNATLTEIASGYFGLNVIAEFETDITLENDEYIGVTGAVHYLTDGSLIGYGNNAYVVVNDLSIVPSPIYVFYQIFDGEFTAIDDVKRDLVELEERVDELQKRSEENDSIIIPYSELSRQGYIDQQGDFHTNALWAVEWRSSMPIEVSGKDTLRTNLVIGNAAFGVFLDENQEKISSFQTTLSTPYGNTFFDIDIPYNAKYVLLTNYHKVFSDPKIELLNLTSKIYNTCVGKPLSFTSKRAIFVGDSITYGNTSGGTITTNNYPKLLNDVLGFSSYDNNAIGGALFTSGYNSVKTIAKQIEDVTDKNTDFLFVSGGVNDYQLSVPYNEFRNTIASVCDYINSHYPNTTKVIWITPINEAGTPYFVPHYNLQHYRNVMTEVIMEKDSYNRFSIIQGDEFNFPDKDGNPNFISKMFGDKLHPTELGYRWYAKSVLSLVL